MSYQTLLDNFFSSQRPLFSLSKQVWNPPTDMYETAEATLIKIEVAGLDESQMQITTDRNLLMIRGHRAHGHADPKINYHLMEIHYGCFERVFAFSFELDEACIKASYEKGFILVEIAKRPARATNVTIEVRQEPLEKE
jgi:HSP20 family protein